MSALSYERLFRIIGMSVVLPSLKFIIFSLGILFYSIQLAAQPYYNLDRDPKEGPVGFLRNKPKDKLRYMRDPITVAEPKVLELPKKLPIIRNLGKRWTETGRLSLGYTEVKGLFQRPRLEFDRLGWELFRGEESLGQPFNERLEESALSLGGLGEL